MIRYGINTFLFASPFRTKDLPFLDKAKAMGFDQVEIPIEGEKDLDYRKAAEAYRRTGLHSSICAVMGAKRDAKAFKYDITDPAFRPNPDYK